MELIEIIEKNHDNKPSKIRFRDGDKVKVYYSLPKAAELIGVTTMTFRRWYKKGIITGVIRDVMSHRFYIPEETVERLKPENRFVPV